MSEIKPKDIVLIKKYKDDPVNKYGKVESIIGQRYWVTNLNQPFCGTISDFFFENELELKKEIT